MTERTAMVIGILPIALGIMGLTLLASMPPVEVRLSGFATRLDGRSHAQRHNAVLAARSLNGAVIPAGGTFSFNTTVKTWSLDRGYVRAPVSYDGELVPAFGGGVCQTSTTLYNAALLAGMNLTERHHHVFAPHYVAPGRDAAVAYPNIDLRFRNPYSYPIHIRAGVFGESLLIELWGKEQAKKRYTLSSRVLSQNAPELRICRIAPGQKVPTLARYTGASGFRVVTYRLTSGEAGTIQREHLSDDSYPATPNVVTITE